MRFAVVAAVASLAGFSAAQNLGNLPTCVATCYTQNIGSSGCSSATDLNCLCKSAPFQSAVGQCLATSCSSSEDISAGVAFGQQSCAAVGVTITTSALTPASSGSSGSGSSAAASSSGSSAAGGVTSSASSAVASATSAAGGAASSVASAVTGAPAAATSAATTGNSASTLQKGAAVLAAAGLAVLAL